MALYSLIFEIAEMVFGMHGHVTSPAGVSQRGACAEQARRGPLPSWHAGSKKSGTHKHY
jgi:hypothetical protein